MGAVSDMLNEQARAKISPLIPRVCLKCHPAEYFLAALPKPCEKHQ